MTDWPKILRDFREAHKMTQDALAKILIVSTRTVERWEAGKTKPEQYLLFALEFIAAHKKIMGK